MLGDDLRFVRLDGGDKRAQRAAVNLWRIDVFLGFNLRRTDSVPLRYSSSCGAEITQRWNSLTSTLFSVSLSHLGHKYLRIYICFR